MASAQFLRGPSTGAFLPPGVIAARFGFQPSQSPVPIYAAQLAGQRGGNLPLLIAPQGSGLEGQYIPDNLESLYDDGSYKPWLYGL